MRHCIFAVLVGATLLGGCASAKHPFNEWWAGEKYHDYIPPTAKPMVSGTGTISFVAPDRGTVYVVDLSQQMHVKETTVPRVLGSGFVFKGSRVSFDPNTGALRTRGQTDFIIENVQPGHKFELRFDPVKHAEEE